MATIDNAPSRDAQRRLTSELLDRLPPQNLDAELGVLGSLLLDPDMCDEVAPVVRAEHFYARAHQTLFEHLIGMHNEGLRIDITLLVERLRKHSALEAVGGMAYLERVLESVPTAANATWYAEIVRDKATLRSLIHASTSILRDVYDQEQDARDLLRRAEERVFSILEQKQAGDLRSIEEILHDALDRIDTRLRAGGLDGLSTGFPDLDQLLGGLHKAELIVLAARPSMGKTALAANIADHVAVDQKVGTLFVSLEMSQLELADRMLFARGRINGRKLRDRYLSKADARADHQRLAAVVSDMSSAPLYIDDSPARTMTEIAAIARRLKRKNPPGLGLVVIDYLQLIEPDNAKDPRQEQVSKIARRLKAMARELQVPVLCLGQLNRQVEQGKEHNRPRLSHLRESGAIEQDADVVMFVHREEYYRTSEEERAKVAGLAEVIVAKNRNGPVGDVKLTWLPEYTRFENRAAEEFADYAYEPLGE